MGNGIWKIEPVIRVLKRSRLIQQHQRRGKVRDLSLCLHRTVRFHPDGRIPRIEHAAALHLAKQELYKIEPTLLRIVLANGE